MTVTYSKLRSLLVKSKQSKIILLLSIHYYCYVYSIKCFEFCSSNMKGVHSARAKFLFNQFDTSGFEMNICRMIKKLFVSEPSYTEEIVCNSCAYTNFSTFPLVSLNNFLFRNDLSNLDIAIIGNFPENLACSRCKSAVECKREFRPHMFIEVIILRKKVQYFMKIASHP